MSYSQEMMRPAQPQLVASDFDGTIADTFALPPSGIGVHEAYNYAIEATFGLDALIKYTAEGGLLNRAPVDVVRQLAPSANEEEVRAHLAKLDAEKLQILTDQISSTWPKPLPGYADFVRKIDALNQGADLEVVTDGLISSGHAPFIRRTYEHWGIRYPSFILAQEAIAQSAKAEGAPMPTKPDTRLMLYAYSNWRALHGLRPADHIDPEDKGNIRYIGDDIEKDGMLAHRLGIRFYWLEPAKASRIWNRLAFDIEQTQLPGHDT